MMQPANQTPSVTTTIQPTFEAPMVRRLVPTYQTRIAMALGITQIVLGIIVLAIAIVVFVIKAFTSTGGSCLLTGIGIIACGGFGILSAKKKEIWTITGHQFLAILSLVFAVVILAAGATAIPHEDQRDAHTSASTRKAVDVVAIVFAVLCCAVLVWSIVLSSSAMYYGCCKQSAGIKYVSNSSNVKFNSSAADPHMESAVADSEVMSSGATSSGFTSSGVTSSIVQPAVLSVT